MKGGARIVSDNVLITLIVIGGLLIAVFGWKLLDIGKRAMELDRSKPNDRD